MIDNLLHTDFEDIVLGPNLTTEALNLLLAMHSRGLCYFRVEVQAKFW